MNHSIRHLIISLLCGLSVSAVPASAQDKKMPKLRWYGQSFFVVETSQGTTVAFDPHAIDAFERPKAKADLVLISHPHPDHVRLESIENRATAKVIEGIKTPAPGPEGTPPPRPNWNPVDETFKDVKVRSVGTFHDMQQGFKFGKNTCFVVEFDGLKLVHLGDLGHLLTEEQIRQIGPVDVLLIPIGGVYTINGSQAKKVVAQLKPARYVLPMHFGIGTFEDLLPADEFLEGQANVEKRPKTNELRIDPAYKPKQPITVMLGWMREP